MRPPIRLLRPFVQCRSSPPSWSGYREPLDCPQKTVYRPGSSHKKHQSQTDRERGSAQVLRNRRLFDMLSYYGLLVTCLLVKVFLCYCLSQSCVCSCRLRLSFVWSVIDDKVRCWTASILTVIANFNVHTLISLSQFVQNTRSGVDSREM